MHCLHLDSPRQSCHVARPRPPFRPTPTPEPSNTQQFPPEHLPKKLIIFSAGGPGPGPPLLPAGHGALRSRRRPAPRPYAMRNHVPLYQGRIADREKLAFLFLAITFTLYLVFLFF